MHRLLVILVFLLSLLNIKAQDQLFKTDNSKLLVKVLEVGTETIKYKDFSNLTGPIYTILKKDVVLIIFENGTHELIQKKEEGKEPTAANTETHKNTLQEKDLSAFSKYDQSIYFNIASLANSEIGIVFQKEFYHNHLNIMLPISVGYGKPYITQVFNFRNNSYYYINNLNSSFNLDRKLFDIGFGINYYPLGNSLINYYLGPAVRYMQYDATQSYTLVPPFGTQQPMSMSKSCSMTRYTLSITNGIVIKTSSRFTTNCFVSLGYKNDEISDKLTDPNTNLEIDPLTNGSNLYLWFGILLGFSF